MLWQDLGKLNFASAREWELVKTWRDRLRNALVQQGRLSVVTTHATASFGNEPNVKGVVVHDWQFNDLMPLVPAVHNSGVGVTQLDVFVSLTM